MNKYRALLATGLCLFLLTGCGGASLPEMIDKTTISVDDKGEVTAYLVETFDKDYYNVSELMSMAVEDAAAYNTAAAKDEKVPVTVDKVEMLETGKDVRITYKFSDTQAYSEYMGGVLFYGTVSEALLAGYNLQKASLCSVKDGTPVTGDWIQTEAAGKHILITNQATEIYCPYAVTHISTAVSYNENGSVSNTQSDDIIYILLKK